MGSEFQSELRKRKRQTDGKFNTIQSELRKLKRKVNKPPPQRVGDCDDGEVPTTDLATMQLGCCIPGFSLAQGKCCQPNFLVKDYVNTVPIGSGFTQSTNCCGTSNELTFDIDAGVISGLNVLRIINEPTAAAIAYGLESYCFNMKTTID